MRYLPCELHCHTVHSDGDFQVRQLLEAGRDDHLALIALTDHNTISGYDELDDSLLPSIRGIEWTTYFGHMLVLGAKKFVDWRNAVPDNIDEKIAEVKDCGGIVGIAHPYQMGSPICTGGRWEFNVRDWSKVDYIEIWHEDFCKLNCENERSLALWTSLLDKGYHLAASYGRDWHRPANSGLYGCTYLGIEGEINGESAITAIRNGRTVVSVGAKFFFTAESDADKTVYNIGDTLPSGGYSFSFFTDIHSRLKDAGEESVIYKKVRIVSNGTSTVFEARCNETRAHLCLEAGKWYRAELWGTVDGDSLPLAITSPIYVI